MLLSITTTQEPATDLGFLLHKNPARAQTFDLSFGQAHVVYPEVTAGRCTASLLLDIDPVGLVRGRRGPAGEGGLLTQYVNDRPYVASSFLSVAISNVFASALAGRSKERQTLADTALPLEARLTGVPCRSGEALLRRLFEPLGYAVTIVPHAVDAHTPEWGMSRYFTVTLTATCRLAELLTHLYVLVPVLDDEKHYWVGDDEVEKLLRHGEGWLATHPDRAIIARRYLKHRHSLVRDAIARLVEDDDSEDDATVAAARDAEEGALERPISLHEQRLELVRAVLVDSGATSILDLGCGEGRLLRKLLEERQFTRIVGMDVSHRALEMAAARLKLDRLPPMQRERISLIHGSLVYRDTRLEGFDAAGVVEVIEHLDPPRLAAFERAAFEFARPRVVALTTPNAEFNVTWPSLPAGRFRHRDHRFEWTRAEFEQWAAGIADRFGYRVRFAPVGPVHPTLGAPTQMVVFTQVGADGR